MPAFRKELCDVIRPHLAGGKFPADLVGGLDGILDRAGCPRDDGSALSASAQAGATPAFRRELTDLLRSRLVAGKFSTDLVASIDSVLDRAGVPRDGASGGPPAAAPAPAAPAPAAAGGAIPTGRLDVPALRAFLGLPAAGPLDDEAQRTLLARLRNPAPAPLTDADFDRAATDLGVSPKMIKAVRKVEAPRGPFDEDGRPSILFERHVFARNCQPKGRFSTSHPLLCGPPYGPGGYGKFSAQYAKLAQAAALDPEAAFRACSWGAFQVLGENAVALGYPSAFAMALSLTQSEAAHLESFVRFVRANKLVEELRACRPGDPASCIPFVRVYNGSGFREFSYHEKLAKAAL
jgi:hypothetical protein